MTAKPETHPIKKHCAYCEKEIHGREGKMYCNVDCKNNYNSAIRAKLRARENEFFPKAIKQIKANYRILLSLNLNQLQEDKEIHIRRVELSKQGFDARYCTTSYKDNDNRIWKCCFDHIWQEKGDWLTLKYDQHAFNRY